MKFSFSHAYTQIDTRLLVLSYSFLHVTSCIFFLVERRLKYDDSNASYCCATLLISVQNL